MAEKLFEAFNFEILNDPNYKEDSVREDIVAPILNKLGFSSTGKNKIIRSKTLTHPFVYIGSKERRIYIIPDYLCETENGFKWILDAKAPTENIDKGNNLEQAYSYAIHPEVRAGIYALCNGHKFNAFHISEIDPIYSINIKEIDNNWEEFYKFFSPFHLENPVVKFFDPDLGIYLFKQGVTKESTFCFVGAWINTIAKVNDNLYTFFSVITLGQLKFAGSFDFPASKYDEFINSVPVERKEEIIKALTNQPYIKHFSTKEESFEIIIEAKLGDGIIQNKNELYLPLDVLKFDKL